MKKLLLFLALTLPATGQTAPSIPVDQANAQKAKSLLNQAVEALGGPAYLTLRDISSQGRTYSFHHGESTSAGILFWRFYRFPDKDRIEATKQRDVIEIFNGDKGYEVTFKGAKELEAKDLSDYLRRREFSLDWVLRKWLSDPTVAFFYEGSAIAAQKPTQQVTLMNRKDQAVTLYLDEATHLPVKKMFSWRDPTDKERNIEEEVYDAYRLVGGVMTPFSVSRYYNGDMSNQRFLNSVTYNTGLADSLFEVAGRRSAIP